MKTVKIKNKRTNEVILEKVYVADTFFERLKGLMGKKGLEPGEALLIKPCSSVHSFHMKFLFDVAFFDKNNKMVHVIHSMKPLKTSPVIRKSKFAIETSGDYLKTKLQADDEIEIL
jgi:uncharacterized membrane protein (UPF0127 family)